MPLSGPVRFSGAAGIASATDWIFAEFGRELRLATPLGLGKPNPLLNAVYAKVAHDRALRLVLFTALSLAPPDPREDLAKRFFGPFRDRHWGADYPALRYTADAVAGKTPLNVRIHEFYFQAGSALKSESLQRNYIALNYTHVAETVADLGVDGILQLIARRIDAGGRERFSLASNPDLTLDLATLYRKRGKRLRIVGVVHPDLPFLGGDAEVEPGFFSAIVDSPEMDHALFALPRLPVDEVDHAIGFHASRVIRDGGTLQIGIGSLSDAVVAALIARHSENARYRAARADLGAPDLGYEDHRPFSEGLYGLSEMVTDGFMHLRNAGILKREVVDEATGTRTFLHGAFFLGSKPFYEWLRNLPPAEAAGVRMTRVSKVNDLYDPNEILLRRQRKHPRFLNTCMQATLLGGAASETLADGRVVSGVGGQYNFVAMAHELPDSRSLILLRSTREKGGGRRSNIVWSHGRLTIPRHLRDLVVTEYGVADLRGQDDETCIRRMLAITDAEFQPELLETAKRNGKLAREYALPRAARENRPENLKRFVRRWRESGLFAEYPFGSDFTAEERRLVPALESLKSRGEGPKWKAILRALDAVRRGAESGVPARDYSAELARMGLGAPAGIADRLRARALRAALRAHARD
jgi:acyl-CoA hydrolase